MRVQEHLYQGFFGLKKKKDSAKYYSQYVEKLKGIDSDLDMVIEAFQHILTNHNQKLKCYHEFLQKPTKENRAQVYGEIRKLEGMFDDDELANNKEKKYILKGIDKLESLLKDDESPDLDQLSRENMMDFKELLKLLRSIEPVWEAQIDFIKKNDILNNSENIVVLSKILSEEGSILRMEETLLRKIDLKTGTILRKASLMERDIRKTKDMDMSYRELKYIR